MKNSMKSQFSVFAGRYHPTYGLPILITTQDYFDEKERVGEFFLYIFPTLAKNKAIKIGKRFFFKVPEDMISDDVILSDMFIYGQSALDNYVFEKKKEIPTEIGLPIFHFQLLPCELTAFTMRLFTSKNIQLIGELKEETRCSKLEESLPKLAHSPLWNFEEQEIS